MWDTGLNRAENFNVRLLPRKSTKALTICYSIFASRLNGKQEFGETLLIIEKLCTVFSVLFDLISEKITTEDGIDG